MIKVNCGDMKHSIAIMVIGLLLSFNFINCEKDDTINKPTAGDIDDQATLKNDKYEPNDTRTQAYKLEYLPFKISEGLLISKDDIDWFKFSITDDTLEIKFIFDMSAMTEEFGLEGCLYGDTEFPKGCFHLYKGLDSEARSILGWECAAGDYYFFVKVDTAYEKESGKYSFEITK